MASHGWPHRRRNGAAGGTRGTFLGIAVLLVIIALPYERFAGPASLRLVDGIVLVLCVYTVATYWRSHRRLVFPLLLPMLLIMLSSLIATTLGFAYMTNILAMAQEVYLWIFLVVMTNLLLQHNQMERDRLLKVWVLVACVVALTTLMGMLHIGPSMFYEIPERARYQFEGFDRGVGTYVNPNAAAAYLSTSFFIAIGTPVPLVWRVLACCWIFTGMYSTGSNGAMGTTLLSLGILMFIFSILQRRRALLGWLAVGTMGTAVALFLLDRVPMLLTPDRLMSGEYLSTSVHRSAQGLVRRLHLWEVGWREFQKRPWGVGPNSSTEIHISLHSDYLAFLFERGPVGFLGWMLLLLEPLVYVTRAAIQTRENTVRQWQILALGAGFLANVMNSAVHELSHTRPLWLLMAFMFAQSIALFRHSQKKRQDTNLVATAAIGK